MAVRTSALEVVANPPQLPARPVTRGDCRGGIRPCPWVSCRHNLLLELGKNGSATLNNPATGERRAFSTETSNTDFDRDSDEMVAGWIDDDGEPVTSCALDAIEAARGPLTLEATADLLCVTRERVRQVEVASTERMSLNMEQQLTKAEKALK